MMINLKDGTWKYREGAVYYRNDPRTWYCKDCNYVTTSPKSIGEHTVNEHGFHLPRSRNAEPEQTESILQKVTEPEHPKLNKPKSSIVNMLSKTQFRLPDDWDPLVEARKRIEAKKQVKIDLIKEYVNLGVMTRDQAQIECMKIILPKQAASFEREQKERKEREQKQTKLYQLWIVAANPNIGQELFAKIMRLYS